MLHGGSNQLVEKPFTPPLFGDRTLLYRALFNLAENAVKYNRTGGSISLSAEVAEALVTLKMTDTGIGIPQEDQAHIFEPFYRIDRSPSRAMGGSGLGLSLVRDIIEKHGGCMAVESIPGEGSTFTWRFPKKTRKPFDFCGESQYTNISFFSRAAYAV